jgi:hypothetical protein
MTCYSLLFFAQKTAETWTKDEKTNLYNEASAKLTSEHTEIKEEKREDIALCYVNRIASSYPFGEWSNKMEVEAGKIKKDVLAQCIKSAGKEYENKIPTKVGLNSELLFGSWKSEDGAILFSQAGSYVFEKCSGQWILNGSTITLTPDNSFNKTMGICKMEQWDVVTFTEKDVEIIKAHTKKHLHLRK